jgi:hypothetical protein
MTAINFNSTKIHNLEGRVDLNSNNESIYVISATVTLCDNTYKSVLDENIKSVLKNYIGVLINKTYPLIPIYNARIINAGLIDKTTRQIQIEYRFYDHDTAFSLGYIFDSFTFNEQCPKLNQTIKLIKRVA